MELFVNNAKDDHGDYIQVLHQDDVNSVITKITQRGSQDDAFYICNVSDIIRKYQNWRTIMPRIQTYYAVKCNQSNIVLQTLASLGSGFDCASCEEIDKVLSLGVHPSRIIYAHPTKKISQIKNAAIMGVSLMTFDSEAELKKIKIANPNSSLVLRIRCDDLSAHYVLGRKFGCDAETEALDLLRTASALKLKVVGVSYHIGSQSSNFSIHKEAIRQARHVFDIAESFGYKFNLLDIGGGYPGGRQASIKQIGDIINSALDEHFPDESIKIISEPGCYYVESAFTLATHIHTIKTARYLDKANETSNIKYMYYVDTGIYHSLYSALLGKCYEPIALGHDPNAEKYRSIVWGSTCDVSDIINEDVMLPAMDTGDWIVYKSVGDYTISLATQFHNFPPPKIHSVVYYNDWLLLTEKVAYPLPKEKFVFGDRIENYMTGLTK